MGVLGKLCQNAKNPPTIHLGKQALVGQHSQRINDSALRVSDSLNLESWQRCCKHDGKEWDYLLGLQREDGELCLAIEVHPAKSDQVDAMIGKMTAAKTFLNSQLGQNPVKAWYWIASGNMDIPKTGKERRCLQKNGLELPRKYLTLPRDLRERR